MSYSIAFVTSLSCCWAFVPVVGVSTSIALILSSDEVLVD